MYTSPLVICTNLYVTSGDHVNLIILDLEVIVRSIYPRRKVNKNQEA